MATQRAAGSWRTFDTLFKVGTLGALSDGELLERFRNGRDQDSEDAFRTLVERYGPMIMSLCRSMLKDAHEADDAFQATFLVLVQRARSMQHHETLGPWLYAVASRVGRRARNRLFRRAPARPPCDGGNRRRKCSSSECQLEEQVILDEIAGLPASFRGPIVLCCLQGLSYDLAAVQLGVTEPTVRGRLYRARRRLAMRLRPGNRFCALALGIEPFRLAFPALPAGFVGATVQLAMKWASLRILLVRETGISESVTRLAREVNRSLLFPISRLASLVALFSAGVLGTVVLAQQQANRLTETTSQPSTRSAVSTQEKAANPGQPADKIHALSPRQQFEALLAREEDHLKKIQTLKCVIDVRSTLDGGKTWKHNSTLSVWKRGPIERVHRSTRSVRAIGAGSFDEIPSPQGELDALFTPERILSMEGVDPSHPPTEPVTVLDELVTGDRIGGLIQPAAAFGPGGYQHALAADFLMLLIPGFQHSLRDLYEDRANSGVKPIERRGPQGNPLWDLDLKTSNGRTSFVLTLSPRHGYAIIEKKDRLSARWEPKARGFWNSRRPCLASFWPN